MATSETRLTRRLRLGTAWELSIYAIVASFTTYFCMYGYRKAFAAGEFAQYEFHFLGSAFALKSALIISQLIGYALSKYIGIKINSELPPQRRAMALLACVGFSELSLLAFAILPPGGKVVAIFFSGLPLGMVWGMVFSFLEGRRQTELLGAGLSCSFIVASGFAKTVGQWLIERQVPEVWMPFVAGLCYAPVFLIAVWMLAQLPPPSLADEAQRVQRRPMNRSDRWRFFLRFSFGLTTGFIAYVGLTILRDFRDNFAKEILTELDPDVDAAIFTKTEVPIALAVLALVGLLFLVRDNRRGFFLTHCCALIGAITVGVSTFIFDKQAINGVTWMILSGFGVFLAYVPFNCIFYDRMIAAVGTVATSVFCITVADALGYTGAIGVYVYEQYSDVTSKVEFFRMIAYFLSVLCSVFIILSWIYFAFKTRHEPN